MNVTAEKQVKNKAAVWFIQCTVGDRVYGLDMNWVRSIQRVDQMRLAEEPNADGTGLVGWILMQNDEIPVYDLALRMGEAPVQDNQARIIYLNDPEWPWALLVDRVSQVLSGEEDSLYPFPAAAVNPEAPFFNYVLQSDQQLLLFLAPERLHPEGPSTAVSRSTERPAVKLKTHRPLASQSKGQLVVFYAANVLPEADYLYGLSLTQVAEVLEWPELTAVPYAPEYLLGFVNWRKFPVPVIDLAVWLGLPLAQQKMSAHTRVLLIRVGEKQFVGLAVHPQVQVWRLPFASRMAARPEGIPEAVVKQAVQTEGELLLFLDLTTLWGSGASSSY